MSDVTLRERVKSFPEEERRRSEGALIEAHSLLSEAKALVGPTPWEVGMAAWNQIDDALGTIEAIVEALQELRSQPEIDPVEYGVEIEEEEVEPELKLEMDFVTDFLVTKEVEKMIRFQTNSVEEEA